MSDIEKNKQLVVEFMQAFSSQDNDRFRSMMADDCTFEIMGDSVMSGVYSRSEIAEAARGLVDVFPEGIQLKVTGLTAEGERVAMEMQGSAKTVDGKDYNNIYHQLYVIRGGKIKEVREYLCTKLVNDVLSPAG